MTSPQPDQSAAYQDASARTRAQLLAYAAAAWAAMPDYRDTNMDRLIAALVPRVLAGQLAIANLTSVHLAQLAHRSGQAGQLTAGQPLQLAPAAARPGQLAPTAGQTPQLAAVAERRAPQLARAAAHPVHPAPVDSTVVQGGRGVPPEQVYRRPAVELYTALSKGVQFDEAVKRGQTRLESLVATDLQMAKVRQADASLKASGAKYFRRVLKGEHNCALCIIASTQRYKVGNLLPIHPGCDCDVEPLEGRRVPNILDRALLEQTHQMVKEFKGQSDRSAAGYRDLIVTHEHGEIGPVMAWRKQKFTGPSDLH
jgi:hypothetical protein